MKLSELAKQLDGDAYFSTDLNITNIATLTDKDSKNIKILMDISKLKEVEDTHLYAYLTPKKVDSLKHQIVVKNIKHALAQTIELFQTSKKPIIHSKSANLHPSVKLGKNVIIGCNSYVGKDTIIGDNVMIYPNVTIVGSCTIGCDTTIESGTVIKPNVTIGKHTYIGPNNSIGIKGFGFYRDNNNWKRIPHPSGIIIGNYVEIGSNNCIASGCLSPTIIKDYVKMDTLNHIAHNCIINEDVAIASNVILGGSSEIGAHTLISGSVTISDHIKIGHHCTILGKSGVSKHIKDKSVISGFPAQAHKKELKFQANLKKIVKKLLK